VSLPDGGTLLLGGQIAGQSLLARNYYSAGKGYYEEGRYDQAAESLGNVARLAPGSVEAENAKRLLANIDVVQGKGQGKGKPASQQEKALGRQVQTEIAAQNVKLEQKQQAYIEQAGKVLKSGNLGEAQAAYKAAESLGEQLLAQGASKGEQDARLRQSRQEFAQLQQQQSGQVDQLRLQYEHFKSSGDVTKALAVGNALKGLVIEGEQKKALTGELEKLAIASVQHSDRVDRVEMAAKAEDVSSPQAGAYSYYGATRIRDLSSQMSVNAALPPVSDKPGTVVVDRSGSMTTDQPSGSRFTRWDGRRADEQDAFTNGPSPRLADTGKSDRTADESALSSRMELSDASARPMWTEELNRLQERLQSRTETETTNAPTGQPAPDFNYPYRLGPWARLGRWRQGEPSGGQMGDSTWDLSVRPRDVDVLKEKAKALRSQQKYDQALEMVEQVLLIDPSDAWAANEKQVLTEFSALKKDTAGFRTERTAELESQTALRDANTPWYEYIRYPRNWKQLAESRKEFQAQAAGETEADAAIREKLKPEIERLSFTDIDLRDVITFLREYSDANIHVNWRALAAAGIEQTTKVSVDVRKISVKRALDLVLLEASGSGASAGTDQELRYGIDGGVLTISTKADLAREPIRRVYDVRDLLTPVPDFEGPRTELRQPANAVFGTGGTGGGNGIFEQQRGGATGRGEGEMTKEKLMENFIAQIRNSVDQKSWGDDSTGPTAGTPGFVQILNGALVVTQTPENHQAVAEFIEKLRQAKAQQGRRPAARMGAMAEMRVYDIRDLVFGSDGNKMSAEEINRRAKDLADRVRQAIGSTEETWAGQRVAVDSRTNKLIVAAGPDERRRIEELLAKLREIRGPQVELGGNIAEQEAQGLVKTGAGTLSLTTNVVSYSGRTVVSAGTAVNTGGTFQDDIQVDSLAAAGAQAGHEAAKAQFEDFIRRNYDWQFTVGGTGAQDMAANINGAAMSNVAMTRMQAEVPILHGGWSQFNARSYDMWVENLAALSSNLGQSVVVNSSNIAVTPAEASQLGIQFQQGVNSLRYATVDEAQLRTLRQLEARQAAAGKAAPTNPRLQNTIVGTEALLSGGQRAYVARALSGSNTFDVAGNPIALPHEKYILLDAGGYITAAKASQMQHWTQPVAKEDVGFADVPQELDVPRVGNLVRFEKTLIRPADRLTIRAEYTWKGAVK
jgi:autotransporter-associated beta strand protein